MKPIVHPPPAILRAYGDLIHHVFVFLRARSHDESFNREELFDLANAMHNVAGVLTDYGSWTDDERYREYYLRPFNSKWRQNGIGLEEFLERRLRDYVEPA